MKRFFAGLAATIGALALALGLLSRFLPVKDIVNKLSWLSFIREIERIQPYELLLMIAGSALLVLGIVLIILLRRGENELTDHHEPATNSFGARINPDTPEVLYRADNLDIKARVRDLLHRSWVVPFISLFFAFLLYGGVQAITHIFLRPFNTLYLSLSAPIISFFELYKDPTTTSVLRSALVPIGMIASGAGFPDFTGVGKSLIPAIPGLLLLIVLRFFLFNPLSCSRGGYFTQVLFGKKPSFLSSFKIGRNYKRFVGGTIYRNLWLVIHAVSTLFFPAALYVGGITIINAYPEQLTVLSIRLVPILAVASVALLVVMIFIFINRCLAYSLVPSILSSIKSLPARRAMRASRYLMRGHKSRLVGLWLSFAYYFVPSIAAAAVLILLSSSIGKAFAFPEIFMLSLKRFLYSVIGLNQLLWIYVAPISFASFYAFYLEIKKEFKDVHPALSYIIAATAPKMTSAESIGLSSFVAKPEDVIAQESDLVSTITE